MGHPRVTDVAGDLYQMADELAWWSDTMANIQKAKADNSFAVGHRVTWDIEAAKHCRRLAKYLLEAH